MKKAVIEQIGFTQEELRLLKDIAVPCSHERWDFHEHCHLAEWLSKSYPDWKFQFDKAYLLHFIATRLLNYLSIKERGERNT